MKINTYKNLGILFFIFLALSCSVKKDKFINRTFHAKTAKYNILYNGGVALETGLKEINTNYQDNFWDILPVERLQEDEEAMLPGETKNPNFIRAEDKAIKAIQKHSMNIGGSEKNSQMDEAYILLGKARYYDNRFIPALEAFNYVLYKYPNSDKIYAAKVWREKINIKLGNEQVALDNLKKLLNDKKIKGQDLANANAMLAQAYMKIGVKDSALAVLKIAKENTKFNDEKARYAFIVGQLYESLQHQDSANMAFQEIIDMKRKAPRKYTVQAHVKQAQQFNFKNGDTLVFLEKFEKLLEDRENRPFLDVLNHQLGLFYDQQKLDEKAIYYYNQSLRKQSKDIYLGASNYRNIAEIYFYNSEYQMAGKYYDSTLVRLNDKTREYRAIAKKRENLEDVIKYETLSKANDSIIYVTSLSVEDRDKYYSDYIEKLKISNALKEKELERLAIIAENEAKIGSGSSGKGINPVSKMDAVSKKVAQNEEFAPPGMDSDNLPVPSKFYFYNPTNVASGKSEFRKKWGKRTLKDNWRLSSYNSENDASTNNTSKDSVSEKGKTEMENPAYKISYYTDLLPTSPNVLDSLKRDRDFADFQLGSIYKEKFNEYQLAASKFEKLLNNNPETRFILPSKYNLLKIYEVLKNSKADEIKNQIVTEFPESRYAQIIQNPEQENKDNQSPEAVYSKLYKEFETGNLREVYKKNLAFIDQFTGDEMAPKFEYLKAQILARLKGIEEYKTVLNFVALNYPNTKEGKKAEQVLKTEVPILENMMLTDSETSTYKIVFPKNYLSSTEIEELNKKLDQYIADRNNTLVKKSNDIYDENTNFIVIHGIATKELAQSTIGLLKEYKDYKITDQAYVISSENYKVVQIKKNWKEYLLLTK